MTYIHTHYSSTFQKLLFLFVSLSPLRSVPQVHMCEGRVHPRTIRQFIKGLSKLGGVSTLLRDTLAMFPQGVLLQ